jgi:hypothetical protein
VRALYKYTRHPLHLSFFIAFWCAPTMTVGHLVFAALCTGFVLFAVNLEESALRHVEYTVELGFADAERLQAVLASNSYCTAEDRMTLAEQAAAIKKKASGTKKAVAAYGAKGSPE